MKDKIPNMEQNLFSKVSIVIPAKDEDSTLGMVLNDLFKAVNELKDYFFEVIVVNDHSVDKTKQIAESFGVKVIENRRKPGKGSALISGFENATGEVIVMLDADYSHRPEDIPVFLSLIKRGFGIVVGSRATGGSEEYTLVRTLGNVGLTTFFWLMTRVFLTDVLNGFKAFRREIFFNHHYKSKDFEIEIELLINALKDGFKIAEFPCHERVRAGGKMKSKVIRHGVKFFWKILVEGFKYRISKKIKKQ